MSESVVVGVDGSPAAGNALAWAGRQAGVTSLSLVAVHVLTYNAEFVNDLPPTGLTTWRSKLRQRLEDWVRPVRENGVLVRTVLVEADSVDVGLLKVAAEQDAALLVLGADGDGGLLHRLLGSVTYKVAHRADRPVVIVPADWDR